jgi:SAM-dependent methyltransferase
VPDPALTPNAWLRWDPIRRHLDDGPPRPRILELGIGQGAVGVRLARRGPYTGIEQDPRSRQVAASRLPTSTRLLEDLSELDDVERFDLVCAFEVIEHIEDDQAVVGALVARLEPGGRLLVSVPAHPHRFAAADRAVGHLRRYSRPQLRSLLEGAGLEAVHVEATGFPLGYALEAGRNVLAGRRRTPASSTAELTAASGRLLQPPRGMAPLTQALTLPFRWLQRPFRDTELGTGWVATGRRPTA